MTNFFHKIISLSRYSLLSLIALLLGFWREIVVSSHFGLSRELDVYVAVLGFYLFFGVQVANTLEMVFISKASKVESDVQITAQLFSAVKILVAINILVSGVLYGMGAQLIELLFPGFNQDQIRLGVLILNQLLIAIMFANFSGLLRASLNLFHIFSPGLLSGALISSVSACAVIYLPAEYGLNTLVWGFVGGNGLVLLVLLTVYCIKVGWRGLLAAFRAKSVANKLWKSALVVFLGEICYQGFVMTERSYASVLPAGTISAFYYAWTLLSVPLALVVMPLSTMIYPRLAKAFSQNKWQGYLLLKKNIAPMLLFSLLVVLIVTWGAEFIVKLVLMRGSFSQENASLTAQILSILIFSLPFSSFGRMVRYGLYAIDCYRDASLSQLVTVLTIIGLAPVLMPVHGVLGLAYASAAAISLQSIAMFIRLRIRIKNADAI